MKTNIIDLAGGTFVISAASYATGIAFFNSYYRKLNLDPNLLTIPTERIFLEGGRTLLNATFWPILILFVAIFIGHILFSSSLKAILEKASRNKFFAHLYRSARFTLEKTSWCTAYIILAVIFSYSFNKAIKEGEMLASHYQCLSTTIAIANSPSLTGCALFKSETEIWIFVEDKGKRSIKSIPVEKYDSISTKANY
ncbi:hypothetical protein V6W80_08055 [Pseudomonas benzopyrenica]|uniref:Uncharacterized protein n=1 Tax=Pseudomonas benzopyrenica TaxID=2993566 RepID=A0ABZ2FWZ6_9PSED